MLSVAVTRDYVYAVGNFESAGGLPTPGGLARWSRTARAWEPLASNIEGNGSRFPLWTLAVSGSDIYIGGVFSSVTGLDGTTVPADFVARYDAATETWHALGGGIERPGSPGFERVTALEADAGGVYVGGKFARAGGQDVVGLGRWDRASGAWSEVGGGLYHEGEPIGIVEGVLHEADGWLYASVYGDINGRSLSPGLVRFDVSQGTWEILADEGTFRNQLSQTIIDGDFRALVVGPSSEVYVGGEFNLVEGKTLEGLAVWQPWTRSWEPVGGGLVGEPAPIGGRFTPAART